jgi:putative tricarboxylic transport membrane protein
MNQLNDGRLGIISIVTGGGLWCWSNQLPVVPGYGDVGPAFFPKLIAMGFIVVGIVCIIKHQIVKGKKVSILESDPAKEKTRELKRDWLELGFLAGLTIVYIFLFKWIGFIWATIIFMMAESALFGARNYGKMLVLSSITTGLLFVIFKMWLHIPLPM